MNWRVIETKFLAQYESCQCKCGLTEGAYNSKQNWNHDEHWCKCKKLDDWGSCKNDLCGILANTIVNAIKHVTLIFKY